MKDYSNSALLIVGHGSTENPNSSLPSWQHAETIEARGLFGRVYCTFWKEEPNLRQIWPMVEEEMVYVVPNFISEGYFTTEVIPRELGLDGPITKTNKHRIYYCPPVGSHASMTDLLIRRATSAIGSAVPPTETSLIIAGHGTGLNSKSAQAIHRQVELIGESGAGFKEVKSAFMEEAPFISDWQRDCCGKYVVVVPFFVADGLHSDEDIPVMLGLESDSRAERSENRDFCSTPREFDGRFLYYTRAIGTDPGFADVILGQINAFDSEHLS